MKYFPLLLVFYVIYTFTLVQSQLLGSVTHVIDAISDKPTGPNQAPEPSHAASSPSSNIPASPPNPQTTAAPPQPSPDPPSTTNAPAPVTSNNPPSKPPATTEAPAPVPSPVATTSAPAQYPSQTQNTPATPDSKPSSPGTTTRRKGDNSRSTSDSTAETVDYTTTSINGIPTVVQVPKTNTNSNDSNSGGSKTGVIVGAVIGGIVGVALIGGCLTWFNRHGGCTRRQKRSHDFEDFGLADTDFPHQQQQQNLAPPTQIPQMQTMVGASPTIPRVNDPMYSNENNSYYQPQVVDDYSSQGYYYPSPQQQPQQPQQGYYDNTVYSYEHPGSYNEPGYPVDHYKPDQPDAKPHQYM